MAWLKELEHANVETDNISPQQSGPLHLEPAELSSTRGGSSLLTERQYDTGHRDSPPSKRPRAFHADNGSPYSTELEEFNLSIFVPRIQP